MFRHGWEGGSGEGNAEDGEKEGILRDADVSEKEGGLRVQSAGGGLARVERADVMGGEGAEVVRAVGTLAVRPRVKGVQMRLAGWSPRDRLSECREGQVFRLLLLFTMRVPGIRNYSPGLRAPCGPVSSQWLCWSQLMKMLTSCEPRVA